MYQIVVVIEKEQSGAISVIVEKTVVRSITNSIISIVYARYK